MEAAYGSVETTGGPSASSGDALVEYHPQGLIRQAENDGQAIKLWVHGRPANTQRAYRADVKACLGFIDKPLCLITLEDLQAYQDSLAGSAPASQARRLSSIKSLLSYAHRIGYLPFNVGGSLRLPGVKNTLAERILSESEVQAMIALEPNRWDKVLLRVMYALGGRVSELCSLKWRDTQERGDAGQVTIYGKGDKTRAVLLSPETWRELVSLRNGAGIDDPIFPPRERSPECAEGDKVHLSPSQVQRIVTKAARRAGIDKPVSPHWLRHAHASHALDRGCPVHLVQATLGHASVATTGRYLHARPEDSSARYLGV